MPMLLDLGMRCIAIDCMGYGDTVRLTNISLIDVINFRPLNG